MPDFPNPNGFILPSFRPIIVMPGKCQNRIIPRNVCAIDVPACLRRERPARSRRPASGLDFFEWRSAKGARSSMDTRWTWNLFKILI